MVSRSYRFFSGFFWVSLVFIGFYRVLKGFTGFYRVSMRLERVLELGFTVLPSLPGFPGFYWVFTEFIPVLPSFYAA